MREVEDQLHKLTIKEQFRVRVTAPRVNTHPPRAHTALNLPEQLVRVAVRTSFFT